MQQLSAKSSLQRDAEGEDIVYTSRSNFVTGSEKVAQSYIHASLSQMSYLHRAYTRRDTETCNLHRMSSETDNSSLVKVEGRAKFAVEDVGNKVLQSQADLKYKKSARDLTKEMVGHKGKKGKDNDVQKVRGEVKKGESEQQRRQSSSLSNKIVMKEENIEEDQGMQSTAVQHIQGQTDRQSLHTTRHSQVLQASGWNKDTQEQLFDQYALVRDPVMDDRLGNWRFRREVKDEANIAKILPWVVQFG